MFSFLGTVFAGFFAGLIARAITSGNHQMGFIRTVLLGIAGAFIANYLGGLMGWYDQGDKAGVIMSALGATLILVVYRALTKQTTED